MTRKNTQAHSSSTSGKQCHDTPLQAKEVWSHLKPTEQQKILHLLEWVCRDLALSLMCPKERNHEES